MKLLFARQSSLFKITITLLILLLVQSATGFFFPLLYRDSTEVVASWRGNDLITLFVAVPVLIAAIVFTGRNSVFAKYTWIAMLFYIFYNNCYYLFGASLNLLFFVYVSIALLSAAALILVIANFHQLTPECDFKQSSLLRSIVVISLLLFGSLMAGLWIFEWIQFALHGTKPEIPGMSEGYQLVAAMDLTTQLPVIFTGAFLLWKNKPLGYVLSFVATVSNSVYILVLLAFCPFAEQAGLSKAWDGFPLFFSILILCVISSILFYRNTEPVPYNQPLRMKTAAR